MSSWLKPAVALGLALWMASASAAGTAEKFPGLGRPATPNEVKAWDIDVRPDFKGLPKGQGSVHQGEVLWEAQCASCHGSFGELSEIFTPIAGGTSADDVRTGRVSSLLPGANQPQRTTLMKVSTLSTLWDYINRAMPWNAPKSLSPDEVYAVTAYILNLGNIVPADFVLSDANMREVQQRLPNRKGMTTAHAMWPGKEFGGLTQPDVQGSSCMHDCKKAVTVKSALPEHARNAHGQLADQSRLIGGSRGADTSRPAPASLEEKQAPALAGQAQAAPENIAKAEPAAASGMASGTSAVMPLLQKNACVACHGMDSKIVGPAFKDIANKYKGRADAVNYLSGKIRSGGQGVWGSIPMPPQALSEADAGKLARWMAGQAAP